MNGATRAYPGDSGVLRLAFRSSVMIGPSYGGGMSSKLKGLIGMIRARVESRRYSRSSVP